MLEDRKTEKHEETLLAYCGLHCGDCVIYSGKIADLARGLLEELQESKFNRLALGLSKMFTELKSLENYEQFCDALTALQEVRCHNACRQGGGTTGCKIRVCCQEKDIEGCWLCKDFHDCEILSWLKPIRGDAHRKNLRIINEQGIRAFLRGERYWYDTKDG